MPAPSKPRKSKGKAATEDRAICNTPALNSPSKQGNAPALSASHVARLKALYLKKGYKPKDIAEDLGKPVEQIRQWVYRLKLAPQREAIAKQLEEKALAKVESEALQQLEDWKPQCAELSDDMLDLARKEVTTESPYRAKNLANLASAFKTFSGCYGQFAGVSGVQGNGGNITVNMLYAPVESIKPVEPAVDV